MRRSYMETIVRYVMGKTVKGKQIWEKDLRHVILLIKASRTPLLIKRL